LKVKGALIFLEGYSILFQASNLVVFIILLPEHLALVLDKIIFLDAEGAHVLLLDALVLQTLIQLVVLVLPRETKEAEVGSSLDEIATLKNLVKGILSTALITAIFAFACIGRLFSIETFDTVIFTLCVRQII
jgi:hypothetical protein